MSLFDENLIEIKLYYTFIERANSKIVKVLDDAEAEKMLADEEKKSKVEALTTRWSIMSWSEQNASVNFAYSKTNERTGEKIFDHVAYRDVIIKSCLKQWDILVNGQPVPVTPEGINKLPGDIVMGLYSKYEKVLDYTEDDLKN